jgi:hypothetical protein
MIIHHNITLGDLAFGHAALTQFWPAHWSEYGLGQVDLLPQVLLGLIAIPFKDMADCQDSLSRTGSKNQHATQEDL